jgi:hypothetical protein
MIIQCAYTKRCKYKGRAQACGTCKNNHARNREEDLYVKAEDNPIPDECPKLTFSGPAEHTAGYRCPVCGEHTNPYAMRDNRCGSCGYSLNV